MTTTTEPGTTVHHVTGSIRAGEVDLWYEQRGDGPDVVLLGGLSDTAESWEAQLEGLSDRYRLTAPDNRGAGRSPMIPEGFTVADMADDVAALMDSLGIAAAHVAGFSGGSMTAQELALRHPDRVRSLVLVSTWARPDALQLRLADSLHWMMDAAPSERAAIEAFFVWIYTARAHEEGMVDAIVEEALAFPHPQPPEGFHRQLATWMAFDSVDRLGAITVPTLVVAGEQDIMIPPRHGRQVAEAIPGAELVVLPGEAHQPFQERPAEFDAMVADFWARVDAGR